MLSLVRVFLLTLIGVLTCCPLPAWCQEYTVESIETRAPAEEVAAAVADQLGGSGVKVVRDGTRVVCEIWLLKSWELKSFTPEGDVLYPFTPGQLIGVLRLPRKTGDFRDQGVAKGVYTLRYAQQPVDGAHVGTSPTRDFLLLNKAAADPSPEARDLESLMKDAAEAAGTAHPAMLALKAASTDGEKLRHDEANDWRLLRLNGKGRVGAEEKDLPLDVVVIGHANE
ncbi:MAG: hypothetical protein SGJ19_20520 [Planctomycetia bacterium]|nr:hypothetical protein [Planctomycetia bacterium]